MLSLLVALSVLGFTLLILVIAIICKASLHSSIADRRTIKILLVICALIILSMCVIGTIIRNTQTEKHETYYG